jgi:hypothetical protein
MVARKHRERDGMGKGLGVKIHPLKAHPHPPGRSHLLAAHSALSSAMDSSTDEVKAFVIQSPQHHQLEPKPSTKEPFLLGEGT